MAVKVVLDQGAIKKLAQLNEVQAAADAVAGKIGAQAETLSPRNTGRSAGGIGTIPASGSQPARVVSTYPFAHLIEFGSVNNPPYAPFRRAVDALGLKLKAGG